LSESTLDETLVWRAEFGRPFIYNSTYYYEQLFDRKSKALQIGIYKRIDGKEKWKKEFTDSRFILNVTEYLLISDIGLKHIKRIDLDNGTELWNYTLPEGKITGNLYVYDNILVIPSIAGQLPFEKTFLRGINIISGELVWERESNIYLYQDRNIGLLHSFGEDIYIVINPQTGEQIIRKEFTGIKEKHRLSVYSNMCSLYGDGLYFTSDYVENYYDCQFGKINIQTHEIEFIQRLDVPAGTTGHPPIYHNRRLYIKDSSNTLHIYERGNYN
jgi:outer membrane protein assembly factor BamB